MKPSELDQVRTTRNTTADELKTGDRNHCRGTTHRFSLTERGSL